jgi:alkanesulfonate monooxygenase SsuD/methylene tetrahydromethanopterin reductase-like flavin-dependent oxidoreductase (luciferase family)
MTLRLLFRLDMRSPSFGAPTNELYATALEMSEFADRNGFDLITLPEHHGAEDGFLPAPVVLAAAIAARTTRIQILVNAIVLPFHDPVAVAEQIAVVDQIANGRAAFVMAPGYVPAEFEMFGRSFADRAVEFETKLEQLMIALTWEHFTFDGRRGRITPGSARKPRPPIYIAGSSKASARRAARFGDGFIPTAQDDVLYDLYRSECVRLGKEVGLIFTTAVPPTAVFLSNDPEATWERLGKHVVHDMRSYAAWAAGADAHLLPYADMPALDLAAARERGNVVVLRPQECIDLAIERSASGGMLQFHPMLGGYPPAFAWESLLLLEMEVLPEFRRLGLLSADRA